MSAHLIIFAVAKHKTRIIVGKSTHFFGHTVYGQLIKSLDRAKITEMSRKNGGEKYEKSFDGYTHLLTMLFAVIMRFDSLREIEAAMTAEVRKLRHIGIEKVPKRSTLSDANARRSEKFFEEVYRDLYEQNKGRLSLTSILKKNKRCVGRIVNCKRSWSPNQSFGRRIYSFSIIQVSLSQIEHSYRKKHNSHVARSR